MNEGYPIKIRDVSFASPRGGRVPAYLILPPGKGPFPAVVYLHGSGGGRLDLVAHGGWLAARHAVALTIDSPLARRPRPVVPAGIAGIRKERDLTVQTVIDLRRAIDLLQSLPQVADARIGFVGYSAGARTGAILAGVERRVSAFVLMSGGSVPIRRYVTAAPATLRAEVSRLLGPVDPLRNVRRAAPARLFFQNGTRDRVVPRSALLALFRAASEPKELRWYRAGHGLTARAYRDQLEWLARELRLSGARVPGARAGP